MTQTTKFVREGLAAMLVLFLLVQPTQAQVLDSTNYAKNDQNLFLLGFGELVLHSMSVSGNTTAFENANPALKDGFSPNYRASLFANGNVLGNLSVNGAAIVDSRIGDEYRTFDPSVFRLKMSVESTEPLWDSWRFTGNGLYDPARQWELANMDTRLLTQPQKPSRLELLMRLESDKYGLIEGGSVRPSFKGARFTLHQRSIFGLYGDLHSGRVGAEVVAGKLEGKSFREGTVMGIRADGTSGPFDLTHAPVTRGSEEVKIEVRDRFDETTVLETRSLIRYIDYEVDYLRGRILLHRPVASETISSDPVYIVITFDYVREANDDLYGGRAHLTPVDGLNLSVSGLHRNLDANATGIGVDEPEDIFAGDMNLKVSDHTTAFFEIAGSENPNSADEFSALRVGAKTEVIDNLTLDATFQRIDDQFRSFTNSDLNPTKNQQRLRLGGKFELTSRQTIAASFANHRGLEANGQFNPYGGLKNEDIMAVNYQNKLIDEFGFGVRLERRAVEDRLNSLHEDTERTRGIVDLAGKFDDLLFFGKFGYSASYELDKFENKLNIGEPDSDRNQVTLSVTSKPNDRTQLELGQRFTLRKDLVDYIFNERQDASFARLHYLLSRNINTYTTWEYLRYTVPGSSVQFWQDDPTRAQWAGTFALEYLPLDPFKLLAKTGRHQSQIWTTDSTGRAPSDKVTTDFVLGQLTYFHTHHLSFNAESELRQSEKQYSETSRYKTWDLGLRVNWNRDRLNELTAGLIRRWQLHEASPGAEISSSSYILLLSGAVSVTKNIFARASIKNILLNEPLDDSKTFTRLEAGYDSHSWYRVSLGYERIESDNNLQPDLDYTGQGLFVRLSGKL